MTSAEWLRFGLLQVVLGPLAWHSDWLHWRAGAGRGDRARLGGTAFQGIGILALAILTYVAAELVGGNGFIAAFVGGMVFGKHTPPRARSCSSLWRPKGSC